MKFISTIKAKTIVKYFHFNATKKTDTVSILFNKTFPFSLQDKQERLFEL